MVKLSEIERWLPDITVEASLAMRVGLLPPRYRRKILNELDARFIETCYEFWARPSQQYPTGDWRYWLCLAGRGWGKTWVGAQTVRHWARDPAARIALIGRTGADVRDVMVEGPSGIMSVSSPHERPTYQPSRRRIVWPNGALAFMYPADEPLLLRGPQHSRVWGDELAAWKKPEAWDMAMMGLRLGDDPRAIVTTTPRPTREVKALAADPLTVLSTGATHENAGNLASGFIDAILKKYEGTRLGRQEIYAEILTDNPNALWTHDLIEQFRVATHPTLRRIVVGIDPAVTANENSDETGIIVAGVSDNGHVYVLEDLSGVMRTTAWASKAIVAYHKHSADRIVPEVNNGGDLVEDAIRAIDSRVSIRQVRASKGKYTRAEPVAALYEQGRVHHVGGFATLEDQITSYDTVNSSNSPDRMDALVHAITDLVLDTEAEVRIRPT